MSCFLIVDKPGGMTSRAVVDRVIDVVGTRRVGHAGTLDPLATGVLVVAIEKATRLIEYVQRLPKTYEAEARLGQTSDTDDIEGIIAQHEIALAPTRERLQAALGDFVGTIQQTPPRYSAVKLAGRRAYALARKGKPVELAARPVRIHSIDLVHYAFPVVGLRIVCGSGAYIRSLARDLGERLGVGGLLAALRRTAIGPFSVAAAQPLAELRAETWQRHALAPVTALTDLPSVVVSPSEEQAFLRGQAIELANGPANAPTDEVVVVAAADPQRLVGIGHWIGRHALRPVKSGFQ